MAKAWSRYQQVSWKALVLVTWLSALAYTASEWLFIVTKPSPLSTVAWSTKIRIGLFTLSFLALASYAAVKILQSLAHLIKRDWVKALAGLLPAGIQAALVFLLVDNFTYTLFRFGVATSTGWMRALYLAFFIALIVIMYREVSQQVLSLEKRAEHRGKWIESVLALGLVVLALVTYRLPTGSSTVLPSMNKAVASQQLPHIILLTADGMNATHMSLYGYERDTTPTLRELAAYSIVGENHYSNCTNTIGGLIGILASKYPSTTRVFFPPQLLRGVNAYQHLPGLLKAYGYTTYHFTQPYYADVTERNLLDSFDYVNNLALQESPVKALFIKHFDFDTAYFLYDLLTRLTHRLEHAAFIKPMVNYQELNPNKHIVQDFDDAQKLNQTLDILRTAQGPVFIHLHWMNTHPIYPKDSVPIFMPKEQVFSDGKDINAQEAFDLDFYDDTIYGFDKAVSQLIAALNAMGLYDQTILVVTTDHGLRSDNFVRLPLLMHFPGDAHIGRIQTNTQALDIAPTILDSMGIPIPEWMEGESLLQPDILLSSGDRPIVTVGINHKLVEQVEWGRLEVSDGQPPFYAMGSIAVISCNMIYGIDLTSGQRGTRPVPDSTLQCDPIAPESAYQYLLDHLRARGYDTSSLENPAAPPSNP